MTDLLQRTGDIFGEKCIIDVGPRSASIRASENALRLAMDVSFIDNLAAENQIVFSAIFYQIVAEVPARRLKEVGEELARAKEEIARLKK